MLNDQVGSQGQYYAGSINYQMIADILQIIRSYCADKTENLISFLEETVERSLRLAVKKFSGPTTRHSEEDTIIEALLSRKACC